MQRKPFIALAAALTLSASLAMAQQQGVSANEIVLGTIQDLSGPIAGWGKQLRNGMQMRVEEINAQGGIQGRKLRLIVEDSGYDPKRAVLAAQKLVNNDKIFIMVAHIGTAHNMAAMPVQFRKNVVNFLPASPAREMYEPFHRLKYAFSVSYYDQMRTMTPKLVKEKNPQKICIIYQDDEFGLEVLRGSEVGLKTIDADLVEKTSYKRGATDFSAQVAKMKAANCDFVLLGTLIRETVGVINEARKTGFNPTFLGSAGVYTDLIHKLGGKPMDGLYAPMTVQHPYLNDTSPPLLHAWAERYMERFKEEPAVFSVYGYSVLDIFAIAADKAGPNLSTDSFITAMDSLVVAPDIFGSPGYSFGPKKRLGSDMVRLSQLQNGQWKVTSDYVKPLP
ncbi:hypothetical protein AwPolaro_09030 [Polaromonas sp.]|nr:hypothetical protein AwPolaro_09030 [Polaromonas sp.]